MKSKLKTKKQKTDKTSTNQQPILTNKTNILPTHSYKNYSQKTQNSLKQYKPIKNKIKRTV